MDDIHAQSIQHDSWADVSAKRHGDITVLYYPEDGFAFTNDHGNLDGIEIQIFRQFANYLKNGRGIRLNIHFVKQKDFSKLLDDLRNAETGVFGAGNITITPARKREFQFTPGYLPNVAIMVTSSKTPDIVKLSDLNSKNHDLSAVVYRSTTNASVVENIKQKELPNLKVTYVNSDEAALKAVMHDPHTFTFVDLGVFWMAMQKHMKIKQQPAGDQKSGNIGFIMPLNSDWITPFNDFFKLGDGYKSNPAYRNILVSYLGVDMTLMLQMADK